MDGQKWFYGVGLLGVGFLQDLVWLLLDTD